MTDLLEFGFLVFTSLFTVVNPLGVIPIYISMTSQLSEAEAQRTARKAALVAFITLVLFALTGEVIFNFFSISVSSLRVAGGVLFGIVGYEMLRARISRTRMDEEHSTEYAGDIAITPLAIPMICGPGAITVVIVLMQDAHGLGRRLVLFGVIGLVMLLTWIVLSGRRAIMRVLGEDGNKVMMRLMGLIVMVIAVEFFFAGLTPMVRTMLRIPQ